MDCTVCVESVLKTHETEVNEQFVVTKYVLLKYATMLTTGKVAAVSQRMYDYNQRNIHVDNVM